MNTARQRQLEAFTVRCTKPTPDFPWTVVQIIDVGDKLIHHEERTEVKPAQRNVEATKWTKINNVDR